MHRLSLLCLALAACLPPTPVTVGSATGGALAATTESWTWIPVEDARCGNGAPTGMGVNHSRRTRHLAIYFAGGGACWDARTCFGRVGGAANFVDGYGVDAFRNEPTLHSPLLRRDGESPIRDWTWVYVPYCTGDLHTGDRVAEYPGEEGARKAHHVGHRNLRAFLARLAPALADVDRVVLLGGSAGGLGAIMNLGTVQEAFPRARTDVIDDAGLPIQPAGDLWPRWVQAWNLQAPAECRRCRERLDAFLDHWAQRRPESRIAILGFSHDAIIAGYMHLTGDAVAAELQQLQRRLSETASQRLFLVDGFLHGVVGTPLARAGGQTPLGWIARMLDGAPDWINVR